MTGSPPWEWCCEAMQVVGTWHGGAKPNTDDLLAFLYSGRFPPKDARWEVSYDVLDHLRLLKDDELRYLWEAGLVVGRPDTLLGCAIGVVDGRSLLRLTIPIPPPNFATDLQ